MRYEEAAGVNQEAAEEFKTEFAAFVEEDGHFPQQVFNADTPHQKLPRSTYIMKDESKLSDLKPMKDHFTLLCCGIASGDLKIMPMLVYYSENPRILRTSQRFFLGILEKQQESMGVVFG